MELSGWGRFPRINARGTYFESMEEAAAMVAARHSWIAHGAGKSYGDSALNHDVIFTGQFNQLVSFDDKKGILQCAGGMMLADIIDLVLPCGWFLKVTPGTKLVTVGGAIAGDVHGKNHHQKGCFSSSVLSFRLMMPDGQVMTCSRKENPDFFLATCGGMGLTGLIIDATLQLQAVNSAYIEETAIRCNNLADMLEQIEQHQDMPYSVAWIDCFSTGSSLGRGLVMIGKHVEDGDFSRSFRFSPDVPEWFPSMLVNRFSVRLFNHFYYLIKGGIDKKIQQVSLDQFFYPLDRIASWNRVYGRAGFIQYQFVIPEEAGRQGLRAVLEKITDSQYGAFLAVLKQFGPANENMLSFPMQGYTLALDFKMHPGLLAFLEVLDAIVLEHGGRIYLAKDARVKAEVFEKGYPKVSDFRKIRQQYGLSEKINSLQSRRLKI